MTTLDRAAYAMLALLAGIFVVGGLLAVFVDTVWLPATAMLGLCVALGSVLVFSWASARDRRRDEQRRHAGQERITLWLDREVVEWLQAQEDAAERVNAEVRRAMPREL